MLTKKHHFGIIAAACFIGVLNAACVRTATDGQSTPTVINALGRTVTPAGMLVELSGDMPLKIAAAPDGRSMLIVTAGFHDHGIDVVDPMAAVVRQRMLLGKTSAGLAVNDQRREVYVSGGGPVTDDLESEPDPAGWAKPAPEISSLPADVKSALKVPILRLKWARGSLALEPPLPIEGLAEKDRFIGGLGADGRSGLFAVNIQTNALYKLDAADGRVLAKAELGYRASQLALSPDGSTVAVTNWGDKSVSILDASTLRERTRVPVGIHPIDLVFARDGRLFVANAGSNSVSVIRDNRVVETIATSLRPDDLVGSTPSALALSDDGARLYVTNADNNDVAVVDVHDSRRSAVLGFIPTGWYPSAVALTPDGTRLVVGIAKGIGSRANWPGQLEGRMVRINTTRPHDYVGDIRNGYAEIIPIPDAGQLARYTSQVLANMPDGRRDITDAERDEAQAAFRKIKHVVYVIRENRTYDQVLGDDPRGDGLKDLVFFGRDNTPNAHALVQQSVLLDRYFLNGEASVDGHWWATTAYTTAYVGRYTASAYGGRSFPDGDERVNESPAGYLWNSAARKGLSFFNYGEFVGFDYPLWKGNPGLNGHYSRDWGVPDEDGPNNDVARANIVIRDLKAAEQAGKWPNLVTVWLPCDHTDGLAPGRPTPQAMVAINDLALGMIVDAVSHSSFWDSTAIFVTEDDAQDGPDHVDDHRSVGLVISPYVKAGFIDHTPYTMTSMVRTMELILGLPPMTQYDRDATPMYRLFQSKPVMWRYTALPETVDLRAVNPKSGPLARASLELDLSAPDRADPQALNAILWAALKPGAPMPAPVHSAYGGTAWKMDPD